MNRILIITILTLLLFPNVFAQQIEILTTGGFHEEEVSAKSGETWLGLFQLGRELDLLSVEISVESVFDSGESNDPGEMIVSVPGHGEPVFLVRGGDFRQGGPIDTVFKGFMEIDGNFDQTYRMNGDIYRLMVETGSPPDEMSVAAALNGNPKLILTRGKTSQILYAPERCVSCHWQINWAGDLDGDGKLDLFLYLTDHYNVAILKLFLSASAESGKLVKDVAEFTTTGC